MDNHSLFTLKSMFNHTKLRLIKAHSLPPQTRQRLEFSYHAGGKRRARSGTVRRLVSPGANPDATTAIPLWVAFKFAQRKPTKNFTYGYGRMEDLAGLVVIVAILLSAVSTVYLSVDRLFHAGTME